MDPIHFSAAGKLLHINIHELNGYQKAVCFFKKFNQNNSLFYNWLWDWLFNIIILFLFCLEYVISHYTCYCYCPQRSCGKVMFLHLSVSHSVHGGGCIPACTGADIPPGHTPHQADISQHALGQTPGQTATTGMHSCFFIVSKVQFV